MKNIEKIKLLEEKVRLLEEIIELKDREIRAEAWGKIAVPLPAYPVYPPPPIVLPLIPFQPPQRGGPYTGDPLPPLPIITCGLTDYP